MKQRLFLLGVLIFASAPLLRGADAADTPDSKDVLNCIEPIKSACAGLEEDLESCLAERAKQLSVTCRHVLKSAIDMSQSNVGSGACVADVKQFCAGLEVHALTSCIIAKKGDFSQACRDYLDSASAPAASNPQP